MPQQFKGVIGRTVEESTPWWPEPVRAKEGAPNVALHRARRRRLRADRLLRRPLRDAEPRPARGRTACAIATSTRPRSARRRASCLLTGRNHHSNAMASIVEIASGFPGYTGEIPFENGLLSEMLTPHGYAAYAVGKWHLTPHDRDEHGGAAGPLAARPRLRALLRLPRRRHQPVATRTSSYDNHQIAAAAHGRGGLSPHRGPRGPSDRVPHRPPQRRAGEAVLPLLLHRRRTRAAPRAARSGSRSTAGKFDMGWEKAREDDLRSDRRRWASSRRTRT